MEAQVTRYQDLPDEDLVALAQAGDLHAEEHLLLKYRKMVCLWTRSYFLQGGETDDVIQEGMIGLYKAIRDFTGGSSSFWSFAKLCITRNVISAVKCTTRQKHIPLNSYTSLNRPVHEREGERTLIEMLSDSNGSDPESQVINRDYLVRTQERIQEILSEYEYSVFEFYLDGYSYREIAERLSTHAKSIDNALCRIKTKIDKWL